ncbi:hypothetical protein [Agromyces sp. PvR057]|uniref:hypothetical protein n=1 Tax=Agromyces sp. PvR057 TaxID=3156403 RepID=UPI00339AEE6C
MISHSKARRMNRLPREARLERLGAVNAEAELLRLSSIERTKSIETKASFGVVVGGVLATANFAGLPTGAAWVFGAVPMSLTIAAMICATVALWPRALRQASSAFLESLLDPDLTEAAYLERIRKVKMAETASRDVQNRQRSRFAKTGFVLLIISALATLSVAMLTAALGID